MYQQIIRFNINLRQTARYFSFCRWQSVKNFNRDLVFGVPGQNGLTSAKETFDWSNHSLYFIDSQLNLPKNEISPRMNIRHLSSVIHHHSAWNTSELTLWFCSQKLATSDTPAKYSSKEWPGCLASFLITHSFMKSCIISLLNSATLGPNLSNSEVDDYNI